jgi:hypothetical protein
MLYCAAETEAVIEAMWKEECDRRMEDHRSDGI